MGDTLKRIIVPSLEQIVEINKLFIEKTGGFFAPPSNLLNSSSLEWVLEMIQNPFVFGINQYPSIAEKASLFTWHIINDHVFFDGNKRTGMATLKVFVLANEYQFETSDEEIIRIARRVAQYRNSGFTRSDLILWINSKLK